MKFAHLSDVHIGAWRDPRMRDLGTKAFQDAIQLSISRRVDFVLIAGDLFDTALPAIDHLKSAVTALRQLKDAAIPLYLVAGSHDYSPSGKTMLDVLCEAGLATNVVKGEVRDNKLYLHFTIDKKTGVKITGILGKKGMLERKIYEQLSLDHLEKEVGEKIFMFHTALTEFKPLEMEKMDSHPLSLLPKKFKYYAGGHVHYVFQRQQPEYGLITYPGPTFPCDFAEMEKLGSGGFYIVENYHPEWISLEQKKHRGITIECNGKTALKVEQEILTLIDAEILKDQIITLRLTGLLVEGKGSDINFAEIFQKAYAKGAYFMMKNTTHLESKEFVEIKISQGDAHEIEGRVIAEHAGQIALGKTTPSEQAQLTSDVMAALDTPKHEGETVTDFEQRVCANMNAVLKGTIPSIDDNQ